MEIENLKERITVLKNLLKQYNNLPEIKFKRRLKWGFGIFVPSAIIGLILLAKKRGYSLNPRIWWQTFKNR